MAVMLNLLSESYYCNESLFTFSHPVKHLLYVTIAFIEAQQDIVSSRVFFEATSTTTTNVANALK